jgi:hypothetical protein
LWCRPSPPLPPSPPHLRSKQARVPGSGPSPRIDIAAARGPALAAAPEAAAGAALPWPCPWPLPVSPALPQLPAGRVQTTRPTYLQRRVVGGLGVSWG